jgi:multidrug efflux pump subunit AcrA (membrane-fusion protein)
MFRRTGSELLRMGRRPAVVVAVCVLAILAVGLVTYKAIFRAPGNAQSAAAAGAAKQRHSIAALGRIEPGSEIINLGAGMASDRLETLLVARGDVIKKGSSGNRVGDFRDHSGR